ncbi:MAG: 16S rRNA (cytosine(967)-C(5))-methyltransferase RsmB [Clostridium sp.]|nr:16S rRNA (cytosine(967)-C(5))-methyltransferase RsmB [Clostridium sp.]MCM1398217.1 16S rRNA (cytosine(967)-C(5))-methyltransferase RsmB [Clostridium sp.]MCM1460369.1 16S rRNA (cytosine(967)-C(5))-methyltransferase RsmB [Bacteroides sp.]
MINARDIVLSILVDIENNDTFSNIAITKALRQIQFENKQERAFITRLAEGVTESKIKLDYIINGFSKTPTEKCKPLIRSLLRMGAYQILYMDSVPDSAVCNEAVKLAKKHNFAGLSGFVNGVLRAIARNKDDIKLPKEADTVNYLSVNYSVPVWLCEKVLQDYPDKGRKIIEASFQERKTSIRVNELKIKRDALRTYIYDKAGESEPEKLSVIDGYYDDKALLISGYDFIRKLPGYREGYFTVQDESSMCAVRAAGIRQGDIVIDVCAAPGGKATGAAEFLMGDGTVYARDISEEKLELIEENVSRLGIKNVAISKWDACIFDEALVNKADVVIADLPCSGLGIMGRKNDIKYRINADQIEELIKLQRTILGIVCRYVKAGGILLYSTCTINPEENSDNVKWFLKSHKEFRLVEERQFLQGIDKCDGFYYARLISDVCEKN